MAINHLLIIEPGGAERHYWRDLWRYRELFLVLAWRDVSVRYKQTIIGVAWALVRPVLTVAIFTVVFGRLAGLPTEGSAPYALMVLAGLLPWQFASTAFADASNSLVGSAHLISKVYFPRLIIPLAAVVVSLVDLVVSFLVFAALMAWYRFVPGWQVVFLPVFALMAFLACLGPGLWIAPFNVKYRDVRHALPFLVQAGLYVSPVGFSATVVPEAWRLVYALNPMVAVIDGFRWSLLRGASALHVPGFLLGCAVIAFFLWLGIRQFRRTEKRFADLV